MAKADRSTGNTAVRTRTAASIAGDIKQLQRQAEAALPRRTAAHATQRKDGAKDAQAIAQALENACAMDLHALLDFGRAFGKSPFNGFTEREAVHGITAHLRAGFDAFLSSVPQNSDARNHVRAALAALNDLDAFMDDVAEVESGGFAMELSKRGQGRCIFAFAMDAARAMESAEEAIGGKPLVGFSDCAQHPAEYTS